MFEREKLANIKKGKSFLLLVLDRPLALPPSLSCRSDSVSVFGSVERKGKTSIHNREHYSLSEFSRYSFFHPTSPRSEVERGESSKGEWM